MLKLMRKSNGKKRLKPEKHVISKTTIRWFIEKGILEALSCFFSTRGAREVELWIIPVPTNNETLDLPKKYRKKIEEIIEKCDSFKCMNPYSKEEYPEYPSTERCINIQREKRNYIIYVVDKEQ